MSALPEELDPQITSVRLSQWLEQGRWYRAMLEPSGSYTAQQGKRVGIRIQRAHGVQSPDIPAFRTEAECDWRTVDHDSVPAVDILNALAAWGINGPAMRPTRAEDV